MDNNDGGVESQEKGRRNSVRSLGLEKASHAPQSTFFCPHPQLEGDRVDRPQSVTLTGGPTFSRLVQISVGLGETRSIAY